MTVLLVALLSRSHRGSAIVGWIGAALWIVLALAVALFLSIGWVLMVQTVLPR